jgi:DNA polymerase-3 subunit beta
MINTSIETSTIKALMLFAAKKDIRYYLKGLHIEQSANGTFAVASNGHAIAIARIDSEAHEPASITIDRQYIDGLKSSYAVSFEQVDSGTVKLGVVGTSITVPVLDAKYPDWRRVVSAKQTGEQAYFDPDYAALVNKAGQTIRKNKTAYIIQQNGNSVGYCNLYDVVHAYVMPMRAYYEEVVSSPTFA